MIPLTAEEWFGPEPEELEDDDPFTYWPRSPVKKRPLSKLTKANLAKLGSDVRYRSASRVEDEEATEEGDGELRVLGGFESFFWKTVAGGLGLIYYVVDVEGPVTAQLLRQAARMTVRRHPNLRSRIINGMLEAVPFEECDPIEVPYVESEDVIGYTEEQMKHSRIKEGASLYLWSLALHRTPSTDQRQLVLLIHHSISDGDSILRWLQSLVEHMAELAPLTDREKRSALRKVEVLRQLPSADTQLFPNYPKRNWVVNHYRPLLKEAWNILRHPRVPVPIRHTYNLKERITRISSFTLEPADFKLLMQACKANGTSVTGALTAACLQEMQDYITTGGPKFLLKTEVLVNFRGKVPEEEGAKVAHQLYAAPVDVVVQAGNTPETELDFWSTAKQVKREVDDFLHLPHLIVDALEFFWTCATHPIALPCFRVFSVSPLQGRYKALSVSNLGRTDGLFVEKGGIRLGRMQMGIDEIFYGHSIFLAVASHGGALNFTLSYAEPIVDRAMAERFGRGVIRRCQDISMPPTPVSSVPVTPPPATPPSQPLAKGA